jgi:hypothetical protein
MGGKQLSFSDYEFTTAKKQAKREKFLAETESVAPWKALIELIELIESPLSKNQQEGRQASMSTRHHAVDSPLVAVVFTERSSNRRGPD